MIHLQDLEIRVPSFTVRLDSLSLEPGSFFCLLGPTGSGKSLILETIAGLVKPSAGRVMLDGRDQTREPPERRRLGIVYQDSSLFPHLSVEQNIRYGLRYHPQAREQAEAVLPKLVRALGIDHLLRRRVTTLSGGERQRTALARALAIQPSVLLLDEPLSALDPNFRDEMRRLLRDVHQDLGLTVFMVTHDFTEAFFLADRVAVLREGILEQQGTPEEVFRRPATEFVARFTGMRNIQAVEQCGRGVSFFGQDIPWNGECAPSHVGLRPEDLIVRPQGRFPENYCVLEGTLLGISSSGFLYEAHVRCNGGELVGMIDHRTLLEWRLAPGAEVRAGFDPALVHVF